MSEIKFRVWDEIEKVMWYPEQGLKACITQIGTVCTDETDEGGKLENRNYRFRALFYTGLKDKNGKEIYEGDIVREDNPYTSFSSGLKVIFEQELLQFGVAEIDNYFTPLSDIKGYWEVIGNIYQDAHLLNK